jgi:hypothetical protein
VNFCANNKPAPGGPTNKGGVVSHLDTNVLAATQAANHAFSILAEFAPSSRDDCAQASFSLQSACWHRMLMLIGEGCCQPVKRCLCCLPCKP